MPTGIDRVDQLPLPSLQWYAGFSGLALFYAAVYSLATPEGLFHTLSSNLWCEAVSLIYTRTVIFQDGKVHFGWSFQPSPGRTTRTPPRGYNLML